MAPQSIGRCGAYNFLLSVCDGWLAVACLSVSQERVDHCVDDLVEEDLSQASVERRVELEGHLVDKTCYYYHTNGATLYYYHTNGATLYYYHTNGATLYYYHTNGMTLYYYHTNGMTYYHHTNGATLYYYHTNGVILYHYHLKTLIHYSGVSILNVLKPSPKLASVIPECI